jgi:GH25 family lysozyme M1 (1,4-beta-N-acetylmuramidase)
MQEAESSVGGTPRLPGSLGRLGAVLALAVAAITTVGLLTGAGASAAPAGLKGLDVSGYQGNVNWASAKSAGASFAYVKATEGTGYTNPYFAQQYNGSYGVGLIRGSYHFALPDRSTGSAQADYFIAHGGGWSKDGKTLPGALDIEYNPYGATCYGLSQSAMRTWIASFINRYESRTGRWAVIYTTTNWWSTCTGNYSGFSANDPLWIARYASAVGTLPAGYSTYSFWQWDDAGTFPGDQDVWNGTLARLQVLACNGTC